MRRATRNPASRTEVLPRDTTAEPEPTPTARSHPPPNPKAPRYLPGAEWQALLYVDSRCLGRLTSPAVEFTPLDAAGRQEAEGGRAAAAEVSLRFEQVLPVGSSGGRAAEPEPLRLPVDDAFEQHAYRVQVYGRRGRTSFAAPHAFRADGRELSAGLGVQQQLQDYRRRHTAARAQAGQPSSAAHFAHSSTLTVQSGDGLERLQAIFDVGTWPASLKGIVCRFLVAEAEAAQPSSGQTVDGSCCASKQEAGEQGGPTVRAAVEWDGMAAPKTAAGGRVGEQEAASWASSKQRRLHEQQQRLLERQRQQSGNQPQAQEQQQASSPAVEVPAQVAQAQAAAGAAGAPAADAQPPTVSPKEGKSKRGRQLSRRQREAQARAVLSAAGSRERSSELLSPRANHSMARCSSTSTAAGLSAAAAPAAPQPAAAAGSSRAAAGAPEAQQQPAASGGDGVPAATPAAAAKGPAGAPSRRNRSRSGSRPGRGQESPAARRMPTGAPDQPAAGGAAHLASVPEGRHDVAGQAQADARVKGSTARSQPQDGVSRSAQGRSQAAAAASAPASAPAARPAAAPATPAAPAAPASPPAGSSPGFLAGLHEAELLAADLLGQPAAACPSQQQQGQPAAAAAAAPAAAASGRWTPASEESAMALAAAVWQGAADRVEVAAAATTDMRTPRRPSSSAEGGSGSRPASPPKESSLCSSSSIGGSVSSGSSPTSSVSWGSSSERYGVPENPSEYGLPYNFGSCTVLPWQHEPGPGQGQPSPPQRRHEPLRPQHRRAGSLGASRSMPLGGTDSIHHGPTLPLGGASMPQLSGSRTGSGPCHQRSASSSSASDGAAPPSGRPAAQQHWPNSSLSWRAEPFSSCQQLFPGSHPPYAASQLPAPPPLVPRSHSQGAAGPHWGRRQSADLSCDALAWHPHRRSAGSASCSWLAEGRQQHAALHPQQYGLAYQLPAQPLAAPAGAPFAHGGGYASGGGRWGGHPHGHAGYGYASAPPSSIGSPAQGRPRQPAPPPTGPPPPPLGSPPVLSLHVPESADDSPDLERFLQAVTPQVAPPPSGPQDLTLADLWRWFEAPSTIGCEVTTVGGPRGPATSYYLPYLSAVQLLVPATPADEAAAAAAAGGAAAGPPPAPLLLSYPNGLDSWPERMRPLVQWGEAANMRDRVPLHSRLAELCEPAASQHPLMASRIADLHPFSWFAVAWYPLYRVPEAPLTARFLTFHTLASLWEAASEAADKHRQHEQDLAAAAAAEAQRQLAAAAAREAAERQAEAAEPAEAEPLAAEAEAEGGAGCGAGCGDGGEQASELEGGDGVLPRPHLPSRSYKSILEAGLPLAEAAPPAQTATPTAVCSFPASPTCSDACTRTTLSGSRPHSEDGAGRCRLACSSSSSGSMQCGCGCGCGSTGCGSAREHGSPAASAPATCTPASRAASDAGDAVEPLPVPVAGLVWYATGRDENWVETLVAAQLPAGLAPAPGTLLSDGARLLGSWRGVAVLARPYPVAKGGPLGWDIQQEEMAQCAERLASGAGLVALRPRRSPHAPGGVAWDHMAGLPAAALGVSCPDYEFFLSRSARYC